MTQDIAQLDEQLIEAAYKAGNFSQIVDPIREIVMDGTIYDMDKAKDRDSIRSMAHNVRRSKKVMENWGADRIKALKAQVKDDVDLLMKGKKEIIDIMDELANEVRKPLDDWENVRKANDELIQKVRDLANVAHYSSAEIKSNMEVLAAAEKDVSVVVEDKLHDFLEAIEETKKSLSESLEKQEQVERDQAELQRLRDEKAKQEEAERIAAEAEKLASAMGTEGEKVHIEKQPVSSGEPQPVAQSSDIEHKREINNQIVKALAHKCPVSESAAKAIVQHVAKGLIPNLTIQY